MSQTSRVPPNQTPKTRSLACFSSSPFKSESAFHSNSKDWPKIFTRAAGFSVWRKSPYQQNTGDQLRGFGKSASREALFNEWFATQKELGIGNESYCMSVCSNG